MPVNVTVLFGTPQSEIAALISQSLSQAVASSIVTGFATRGGLETIAAPIKAQPLSLATLVVGGATYPAFQVMDDLIDTGVPADRLRIHLGHTSHTGGRKHPTARYHPMLHSKIYYMELPDGQARAFIGSHNVTTFALQGLNGEAAVRLEGPANAMEFETIRRHIAEARQQATPYLPAMRDAFAWWTREFLDGMRAEMGIPVDWTTVRTILAFVESSKPHRPAKGDEIYFEIPEGIEQIQSFKTETHLFLFDKLPATPLLALDRASNALASYTCDTLGADNRQGNKEVDARWRIDVGPTPVLMFVPAGIHRPNTLSGMQQVRAEVRAAGVDPFEYRFDREKKGWEPAFADSAPLVIERGESSEGGKSWSLVNGLVPRSAGKEKDEAALKLAAPESGSFVLVSLRRRKKDQFNEE